MANQRQLNAKPSLQKMAPNVDIIENVRFEELPHLMNLSEETFNITNQTFDFTLQTSSFEAAVDILRVYVIPVIILIGIIGNSMSLLVFLLSHLRFQSSTIYLAFLNAVDTVFLLCLIVSWLWTIEVNLIHRQFFCQSVLYFSNVTAFLSVYTVVCFTVERWVIVFHPLKKNNWCTRKKALLVIIATAAFSLFVYSHTLWSTGVIDIGNGFYFCNTKPRFYRTVQVITTIDTFITFIIPSVIIIVLNVNITTKIWQFIHKDNTEILYVVSPSADHPISRCSFIFDKHLEPSDMFSGTDANRKYSRTNISYTTTFSVRNQFKTRSLKSRGRGKLQMRTTRSLLIVSTVFVCLNLPSHAFRMYVIVKELLDPNYRFSKTQLLWQHLFQLLYYFNFAVNFFLYSACSKSFRQAVRRLCIRIRRKMRVSWDKTKTFCRKKEEKKLCVARNLTNIKMDIRPVKSLPSLEN